MERVWRTLTVGAALAVGAGCQGAKLWQDDATGKVPAGVPAAPLSPMVKTDVNRVVPASGTVAAGASPLALPAIPGLTAPAERKVTPTQAILMWRNRVDYLPDQTKGGQMGAGLAGQLFLFDSFMRPATPEGKLTVALYDESPRPPGQPANLPEGWEFDKETLKNLRTTDERFGPCYALFLPWPTYRPDVTKVRIAVRFDPEQGHAVYADETRITIDTSVPGGTDLGATFSTQAPGGVSPLGGPPPAGGFGPAPGTGMPVGGFGPAAGAPTGALPPVPPGYGAPPPAGGFAAPGPINPAGPMTPAGAAGATGPAGPTGPNNLPPFVTIARPLGR